MKKSMVLLFAVVIMVLFTFAHCYAEAVIPELPAVRWHGKAMNLEDTRGQLFLLIFYTDSKA